jgi:hypothetical protein
MNFGSTDAHSLHTKERKKRLPRSVTPVSSGVMPPGHGDGRFLNDLRLTEEEKQTIPRWIDAGIPRAIQRTAAGAFVPDRPDHRRARCRGCNDR